MHGPLGLTMMLVSPLYARLSTRYGPRSTLLLGMAVIMVGYGGGQALLTAAWQTAVIAAVLGAGIGLAYSSLPALIIGAVDPRETGAANGLNTLMRSVGTSLSSAVIGMVLAGTAVPFGGVELPSMTGFRLAFLIATGAVAVGVVLAFFLPSGLAGPAEQALIAPLGDPAAPREDPYALTGRVRDAERGARRPRQRHPAHPGRRPDRPDHRRRGGGVPADRAGPRPAPPGRLGERAHPAGRTGAHRRRHRTGPRGAGDRAGQGGGGAGALTCGRGAPPVRAPGAYGTMGRPSTPSRTGASRMEQQAVAAPGPAVLAAFENAKGFMPVDEGLALYAAAVEAAGLGLPLLEVGTYCGRSTVLLADAARRAGVLALTVDHHRGSEEQQPGWEYHDPEVVDPVVGRMDTLPTFRRTLHAAGLEEHVVALVGRSPQVAAVWQGPLGLVFVDGGHTDEHASGDYEGWAPKVADGGLLVIHDVFPDPADGGQAPYRIYLRALESGRFAEVSVTGSLRVLRKSAPDAGRR